MVNGRAAGPRRRIAYDGKVLAYSGDTEWSEALAAAASGADLFIICECLSWERPLKGRLDDRRPHRGSRRGAPSA